MSMIFFKKYMNYLSTIIPNKLHEINRGVSQNYRGMASKISLRILQKTSWKCFFIDSCIFFLVLPAGISQEVPTEIHIKIPSGVHQYIFIPVLLHVIAQNLLQDFPLYFFLRIFRRFDQKFSKNISMDVVFL